MKKALTFFFVIVAALALFVFAACDSGKKPDQSGTEQGTEQGGTEQGGTEQGGGEQGGGEQGGGEQGGGEQGGGEQGGGEQGGGEQEGGEQGGGEQEGGEQEDEPQLKEITGITFESETVTYDGHTHTVTVTGTLPDGVTAAYEGNTGTDAGTYTATATLTGTGYRDKTLTATLTIEKADITGITFPEKTIKYDGEAHTVTVAGDIPNGVTVAYSGNVQTEVGDYTATATLTGKNYNPLTLTAQWHIQDTIDFTGFAKKVIGAFGKTPDVWEFLPETFRLDETHVYTGETAPDYTMAKNVSSIPTRGIGKQLDVIYGTVVEMQDLLSYVNKFYNVAETIGNLYQDFLNNDPENYKEFSAETDGGAVKFKLLLTDEEYAVFARIKIAAADAALELHAVDGSGYWGRVQLSDTNALKFKVGDNSLTLGLNILNTCVTELQFVRTENVVTGYLYENLGVEAAGHTFEKTTIAVLTWDNRHNYISVAGTNGDFFPGSTGRVVELYDAETGLYLGSKVKETAKVLSKTYETDWFPLKDVSGITSVRCEKKANGLNPDTFYVNGNQESFVRDLKLTSRKYDIEMKKVYVYTYAEGKFKKVGMEIPMFFVQSDCIDTLKQDMENKNPYLTVELTTSKVTIAVLDTLYTEQLKAYDSIAELVTADDIKAFVGSKNAYFDSVTN